MTRGLRGLLLLAAALVALALAGAAMAAREAVYTSTNDPAANAVLKFDRAADGTISYAGSYATGGNGRAAYPPFEVAITDVQGSLVQSADGQSLFVVNGGSDTITSFRVGPAGLTRVSVVPSGGTLPVSIAQSGKLLYVLNEGTLAEGGSAAGSISGFRVGADSSLTPIAGSTQPLPAPEPAAAAIGFDPSGTVLVVAGRLSSTDMTWRIGTDGRAYDPRVFPSNGANPFGFAFDNRGHLVQANAEGFLVPGTSISSYDLSSSGVLTPISRVVTPTLNACWIQITNDGKYAFSTNAVGENVTAVRIAQDGSLSAYTPGAEVANVAPYLATDEALSRNTHYLYVVTPYVPDFSTLQIVSAGINAYRVNGDGSLSLIQTTGQVLPGTTSGLAAS